ncbi:tyrosine-type recombinase/integrase [Campylobacter helveticus]|uniref:tyrosine-type recombinase/integrase n=1 Tax=Campylobacter helveticus TaxID=28898 RepID=UPI0022EA785F|nr:site-specific integrase [Campylobacter helveticus]
MKKPLSQRDLDKLEPKEKAYLVPVGEPKQLYVKIHPNGRKVFQIREQKHKIYKSIGEYSKELLNLAGAREKAILLLQRIHKGEYVGNEFKEVTLEVAYNYYFETIGQRLAETTSTKLQSTYNKYFASALNNIPINSLTKQDFIPIFDFIYKKNLQETLKRVINFLCRILELQKHRETLKTNIIIDLKDLGKYYQTLFGKKITKHHKAVIEEEDLKTLLLNLKEYSQSPSANPNVVNGIYFALLTAQRSRNIRFAKWEEIDFKNNLWIIKAKNMKISSNGDNIIPLNQYALKVLEFQKILNGNKEYIFTNYRSVLSESFATRFFKKYHLEHTLHGFRSTFKSICIEKSDMLIQLGISDRIVEMILHHIRGDMVERAYNRAKAIELRKMLMQWYGDYLNSLCVFD